jgi:hypothetical protein
MEFRPSVVSKFSLGQIVATPGALASLADSGQEAAEFVLRHVKGDWGELDADDKAANDAGCAHEGDLDKQDRILSAYHTSKGTKIWIITEYDRSVTTLLLPEEY